MQDPREMTDRAIKVELYDGAEPLPLRTRALKDELHRRHPDKRRFVVHNGEVHYYTPGGRRA